MAATAAAVAAAEGFDVSCMLFGSVAFIMGIFYLLNHRDDDIRGYSWNVISTSIVMFLGVLLCNAWSGCVGFFLLPPPDQMSPWRPIAVGAWIMIGWYMLLQVTLAYVCGVIPPKPTSLADTILKLKCWAVLIGVITAGSSISLWGLIQEQIALTWKEAALAVPMGLLALMGLCKVSGRVRDRVALLDDGVEDDFERQWKKYTQETEDATICLTLAHLIVQVVRYRISGFMPLPLGQEQPGVKHPLDQALLLLSCSVLSAVVIPVANLLVPSALPRSKDWVKRVAGNCVAFCILYGMDWLVSASPTMSGPIGTMLMALLVTFIAFFIIFVLDFIADLECTDASVDAEIRAFVQPLSVLIGFAWKQAFATALTTITSQEKLAPAPIETLAMAVTLAVVVVPAWRWYILPVIMQGELANVASKYARKEQAAASGLREPLLNVEEEEEGIVRNPEDGRAAARMSSPEKILAILANTMRRREEAARAAAGVSSTPPALPGGGVAPCKLAAFEDAAAEDHQTALPRKVPGGWQAGQARQAAPATSLPGVVHPTWPSSPSSRTALGLSPTRLYETPVPGGFSPSAASGVGEGSPARSQHLEGALDVIGQELEQLRRLAGMLKK